MFNVRRSFSTLVLALIPVAIAINIVIGQLIYALKIPLYLDSIGTILVGALAGPLAGALTGLLSNLIWGLTGLNPTYAPFAAVAAVIGLLAGLFAQANWFKQWWKSVVAGLITGLVAAAISAPVSAYVFGGVTGSGSDAVVAMFRGVGLGILPASFAQGVTSDPLDKAASFLLVFLILAALPLRFRGRFPVFSAAKETVTTVTAGMMSQFAKFAELEEEAREGFVARHPELMNGSVLGSALAAAELITDKSTRRRLASAAQYLASKLGDPALKAAAESLM